MEKIRWVVARGWGEGENRWGPGMSEAVKLSCMMLWGRYTSLRICANTEDVQHKE